MRLRITRQTVALGRIVRAGEVVEVDEQEARVLKGAHKAVDLEEARDSAQAPAQPPSTRKRTHRKAKQ